MAKTKKIKKEKVIKVKKVVDFQGLWDKDPENEDNLRNIIRNCKDNRELVRLAASKLERVKELKHFKNV